MNYGKIYIATKNWQSGFNITDYQEGVAYFAIRNIDCKCNLRNPVVYCYVDNNWQLYEDANPVLSISTPEINISREGV